MAEDRTAAGQAQAHTHVRRADLLAGARVFGSNYRMDIPRAAGEAILEGHYSVVRLRSGLILHASDARDLHDLTTHIESRPAITCSIVLGGHVDFSIGDRDFMFGPSVAQGGARAEGFMIAKAEADIFSRRARRGTHIRKVNVTIEPAWFEDGEPIGADDPSAIRRFRAAHLASVRWVPSARLVALAEQVLHPPAYEAPLQRLYLESRAVEIATEAMLCLSGETPMASIAASEQARLTRVCDFVREAGADKLTLDGIAREAGVSVSVLHRLFRAHFGMSVFGYVRARRLRRAREALERDGISVAQAAYAAGYQSPANFATAFRREFGVSPKHVRGRP
ncbi:MAG: helix-turn-helix domain-containing protein [Reyranellaceae bacterium]